MPTKDSGLMVIGAGSMRTGTMSQKAAFEILLGQPCYHMKDAVLNRNTHMDLWIEASESGLSKELAEKLLRGYAACCDYPTAHYYRDLMRLYPNAKVVLSVRDSQSWIESVQGSIALALQTVDSIPYPYQWLIGMHKFSRMIRALFRAEFGQDFDLTDAELMKRRFEARNAEVRRVVPPDRLLEFRVTDGWGPLCRFLDLPVPDVPFPRLNDRDQVQSVMSKVTAINYAVNALASVGVIALGVWLYGRLRK